MNKVIINVGLAVLLATVALAADSGPAVPVRQSGPDAGELVEPARALCFPVLPGYPESKPSGVQWGEPGVDLPVSSAGEPMETSKDAPAFTGRVYYYHALAQEYQPCSGMRVQLWGNFGTPSFPDWRKAGEVYADDDGTWVLNAGWDVTYQLQFYCQNSAANPDLPAYVGWASDQFYVGPMPYPLTNLGYFVPSQEAVNRFAHVVTNVKRNQRVMEYLTGDVVPPLVVYADTDDSRPEFYDTETIYFDMGKAYFTSVLAAQYARVWMALFTGTWDDPCGAGGRECRPWCEIEAQTAYTQGLARWFGEIVPQFYPMFYGIEGYGLYDYEDLVRCSLDYGDPNLTPGFFAAVLHDIMDNTWDMHTDFGSDYYDKLNLGYEPIIAAAAFATPVDPLDHLRWLLSANSSHAERLWETCMNSGYDIDVDPPLVVTGITSSHVVGVPSADGTITFDWIRPNDDASGVAGYSIAVATRVLAPDETMDIGNFTTYSTDQLAPGNWYFNIRAVDRSGHWTGNYNHVGPFAILEPGPIDLRPYARTGWDYPVVPRPTSDASAIFCPAPTSLVGGALTYLSTCGTNEGEAATPDKFAVQFLVDGEALAVSYGVGPVNGGEDYWVLNKSTRVSGGRHTLESFHEWREIYAEQLETNNRWSAQWAWQPPLLTAGVPVVKTAPPDPEGGWDALPPATTAYANCEGFRFASGADWRMVSMTPLDAADDYDLRLYTPTTSPATGFAGSLEASTREVGELEALLVHGRVAGAGDWDVGVVNRGRLVGAADYEIELVSASPFTFGDSLTVTQAEGEMLLLREVDIATENTGWVTITVDVRPATQKVRWYWFDSTFDTGALLDRTMLATSDATGRARRTVQVSQAGYCGLVVARDPLDGTAPDTLIIEVEPGLPDLTPLWATDWYSPLVPRPAQDGTLTLVALPDTLHGNAPLTWFNMAVWNASPAPILADWDIVLDGVTKVPFTRANMAGFAEFKIPSSVPNEVRGGRHTLALRCDNGQGIEELLETNNVFGEQYVWSPLPLVYGTPVTRWTPPDPTGGWQDLPPDSTRYYNCDGLRLPAAGGHFGAVAVMPGDSCNVNVRLHEPGVGAKQGFGESLASSQWGVDQSDYVLVNYDLAGARPFDAGLVNFGGELTCVAEAVAAVPLAFDGNDIYGPFTLPAGRTLDLYALPLTAGYLTISLANTAGTVDWGLGLHPADLPFMGKSTTVDSVQAFFEGPGSGESLVVQVTAAGWYCLAVWKVGSADLNLAGQYSLSVVGGASGVDDNMLPTAVVSALVSIQPNPFNPSTKMVLDVAMAGAVRLGVFDARGRCVRRLVDEALPSGRREVVWDGRDDAGRTMPSGTYFARFVAGGVTQTAKMTLVK